MGWDEADYQALLARQNKKPAKRIIVDDRDKTEACFQARLTNFARERGWLHFHPHKNIQNVAGYPDLTMVRKRNGITRVIFAELKMRNGIVSDEQKIWLELLSGAPVEVYVWYPKDWEDIERILL